ncbi:hypothetical protein L5515_013143 [Caenorhabditis briggsae]|uniref:Uncharacterized protein n=1 Tax=Caenorhabditis briggsae TaxID=6238 RepID=A0AAE9EAH7_CAEBR|nr:hypothetical protein L5515_013143 [Caenorhabditis briggsae]
MENASIGSENEPPKKLAKMRREAAEVFLYMHRIFRASRNLRAHWYIDHLGKTVKIEKVPEPTSSGSCKKTSSENLEDLLESDFRAENAENAENSRDFRDFECPKPPKPEDLDSEDSENSEDEQSEFYDQKSSKSSDFRSSTAPKRLELSGSSKSTSSDGKKRKTGDEYGQEMTVVGIVPTGSDGTEILDDEEEFLVTVNTKCTYISRYYRIVFVLDLSPSVVVADDESNCCLVDRVIPSLRNSLRSSVKPFTIPGTRNVFRPQVFSSVCLFTPFMKFEETFTLCQGVFVTESNVDQVIESVETKFVEIYKHLFTFSRPILELWGKLKRRHKHNKFDSLCENESDERTRRDAVKQNPDEPALTESPGPAEKEAERDPNCSALNHGDGGDEDPPGMSIMDMKRGIWTATERKEDTKQLSFASDKSYVAPDWSLIFMLRMGLLQIQMLPENTQSNLVIISDSVCGMPDEEALQNVLTQLRSFTVAFSFIQLQKKACTEPVFGHVGSSSLFYFMTMATFGTYLPRQKTQIPEHAIHLTRSDNGQLQIRRSTEHDDIIDESAENINQFHRALICWSFQNGLNDNDYLLDTFAQINSDFLELQQSHVDRHRRFVADYQATLNRMMYVRLREGFTLKSTVFVKNNTQVILTLRLAFRPLVFIDYIITSAWPVNKNVHQAVNVELVLEGPYNELKDLLTESNYLNPVRMNLIKSVIDGIIDADRLLLHIHSFDTKIAYFTIPPGVTKEYALFMQGDSSRQLLPQLCIVKPDGVKTRGFVNFWKKMLEVDDGNWQKWVHTQTERCLLNLIHVPFEMFTTERILNFDTRYPLNAVLYSVKVRSTFCLVENQTYVTLVYATEKSKKPAYFFIRKVICRGPVAIVKTAFLGGVTSIERRRAVDAQRQRLINVTYGTILNEEDLRKEAVRYRYEANAAKLYMDPQKIYEKRFDPACTVFRRPIERMVVRYTHVPADLTTIVRAEEKTDDPEEIMLLTLHNTLTKTLACRRSVILLNSFQVGGAYIVRLLADFCQNVLMHKRMHQEGYRPAWTHNNAVSLLRQVYDSSGASLEQFIMFPAITIQPADDGTPILKRISRYEQKMMDKKNNKKDWYREVITKNSMPLAKANETLAIVCEMWNEPEGGNPDDQLANMSSQQRLHEDLRFISVLFTLDIIIRHSGHCNESENAPLATDGVIPSALNPSNTPNRVFPYEDRCRVTSVFELTGMPRRTLKMQDDAERKKKLYQKSRKRTERLKSTEQLEKEYDAEQAAITDVPKPPIPGTLPIRYIRKSTDGEDEMLAELDEPFPYLDSLKSPRRPLPTVTDIHADAVSNFVTVYSNLFSMTNLIYHAQRRYFPLPHFVLGVESTDRPRCNGLQLNALHCQLSEVSDLTWILDQTEQSIVFADLCKTIPDAEKPPPSRLRVYVKALTARMIAMIFVPVSESFDRQSEVIPMFIATCHETQIAHCYALNGFDEWGVVNLPMSDVPERWDSGARFGWTPNNRNVFPDEATTFKSFCDHFDNELLPRIRMRAMYEAAQEDIPLNEDRLMDLSQDVDFIEVEVSAIPLALKRVCRHLDLPDEPKIDKSSRKIPEIVVGNLTKPGEGPTEGKVEKSISFAPEITNLEPENLSEPVEKAPEPSILAENGLEKSENPPEICCKGSNIAYMFDKMLSKNFKKVNGTQNVFYLRPESLLPKDKENQKTSNRKKTPTTTTRRKRYPTRGSSGMMYVDAAESMASFSELGDFSEELDLTQTTATTPAPTSINGASTTPAAAEDPTIPPTSSSSSSSDTSSDDDDEPPSRSSRRQDIHDDSEADESASRLRAESNVAGEVYEEYTGTNQPLFIQFNCSVNFNGRFNSFPICFLPTCVHQLLAMVDDPPTAPEDIADVEIVLELIVLTTQNLRPAIDINEVNYRLARMSKSRVRNPYEFERHRRESYKKEQEEEDEVIEDDDEGVGGFRKDSGGDTSLYDLPTPERKAMTELVRNLEVILELEKILMESRNEKVSVGRLERVKRYIESACTTSGKMGHAEIRHKPFLLVNNSKSKTKRFLHAMENREVGYCRMQKVKDTAMFYCKSINDNALFLETMSEKRELDPDCAAHIPSDDGSDFWIILTVDPHIHSIDVHFCQRYDGQHTDILDELWSGIRQELRTLNQESLLDMMYVQRRADKLLIAESRKIAAFEVEKSDSGIRTLTKKQQLKQAAANGGLVHEDLYYYFPERYFGCKLQREIWLEVPERVRNQSMHTYKNPLQTAFERIKAPLIQYAVHNRSDLFVYKDPETKQIFYFHLHMDADSYQLAIKGAEKKLRSKHLAAIQKSLETSICMTIFGIQEPSEDVVGVFLNALQDKLDGQLLGEIMKGYTQNMEQALSISEVQFLQPHGPPDIRQFFSIPFIFEDYLSSLLFYIGQHIEALPSVSPAKVKENDIFYNGAAFNRAPVVPVWPAIRTRSFRHRLEPIAQLNLVQPTVQFSEKVERIEAVEEKVDQKVETPPQRIAIVPLNGPIPILQTQESEIEQAIEAVPELTPTPIPPPPEPETPPLDPAHIFRAETPFVGPVPADYLLNSFFVYHILPARGIVDTGIALIEFRICRPDGSLMTRFDQPAMNEQSHTLLVPNVPEDKATVYRDIIKSHVSHSPKPEKSICGHLEMIVWTKGDVVNDVFERMMYELIEQSMFDVITEFGYLNTTIVEEGALTGHVALTNRSSDAFLPGQETPEHHQQQQQPVRHLTKQGSASSVTASVDTRHTHHHPHHHHTAIPSHSGEMRRSLVHGPGSLDIPLTQHFPNLPPAPRTPAFRMPQIARELEQGFHQQDSVFRRQDYMNRKNAYSIIKWLDHVASRQSETSSVIKQRIRFEFQHASLPALFEIRNRLEVSLGTLLESEIRERVYLCGLKMPGAMQHDSTNESVTVSNLSIFGATPHEGRFEVLTTDPFHAMTEDTGVDESQSQEEYILVSCIRNVFDGFGENDIRTKSQVDSMRQLFRNHLHGKYSPLVQTNIYAPRQRLMMAYLKGDFMTVYFYNYHSNIHRDAVDTMKRIVGFHNAKSRLLREIGLHKMGITHLSPFHTEPLNEYDYEVLIWTDPMSLISKEFPSEHKPPPAFMKEPQCSNIFFRMYRQPDLQTTMGRSKTLFKSECVKTMHYEQLLRWRAGLKTKLDFIQKVTRAHMEMLKRIPEINECDLLMFLRPPKVAKKLGPPPTHTSSTSSVRHRHCLDDDHHTVSEDNYSITERTSKRASILGESVKSQAIAESEIFKGKGEFLRKTEIKLGLAAEKFHEIRTPFFLRSDWNRDAPRRAGELFDEVVRESDIRSLLEEPLKEFLEISQVQKTKSTKLLMKKRKYSEKSVDVIVSDVVVKNEKRQIGEEEDEDVYDDDWSEVDSELEENLEETMEATTSSRMDSESRNRISRASVGEEDFQRTYGKVRRSWKTNPPGSPTPLDSRHNSFSSSNSTSRPSDPGAIEKMFSSTINAVSKLTRRLSRRTVEKEPSIERPEDLTLTPDSAPSPEPTDTEECSMEPAISPIMFKHAEEFSRYFCRKYGFIQFQVENRNRRSKSLNRYTTSTTNFQDLPYLVFYKALDGGVIFADLRYEIPEFVVSFYMYERAKSSSADYYMVDRMEALYWKESEELHTAANQLKLQDSVCFMTFNFDYHLRAVCTYIDGRAAKKKCLFGTTMNAFHTIERLLDFYQHDLILSKNLVAIKYLYMTKEQNDAILARAEDDLGMVLIKQESDPVTRTRYAGTPIEDAMCRVTETTLYKSKLPVTIIEMTGLLSAYPTISGRQCSRVVPSIKLRVHMDDVGDGDLWPPSEDREFVEEFEGRQRRRLLENMSKYGTELVPTPWEDSCVRRTVKEMMKERKKTSL